MSECMTQEDAVNMSNEQALQILKPLHDMLLDQYGCPISDAFFALGKAIEALKCEERNMNNKVNLCDSCRKVYPECESTANDIFFGNGVSNDNVCACPHYEPKERKKGKWIKGAEISNRYLEDVYYCSNCHKQAYWDTDYDQQLFDYCPYCGSFNGGQASE